MIRKEGDMMSLKDDFNGIVEKRENAGHKIDETELFRDLAIAIKSEYGNFCSVAEMHGNKYQTEYDYYLNGISKKVQCELCDLFLIFKYKKEVRYSCLQAKYSRDSLKNNEFYASLRQHYLLSKRPVFDFVRGKSNVKLLSDATMETSGSFGVFFRQKDSNDFDMAFSAGSYIEPKKAVKVIPAGRKINPSHKHRFMMRLKSKMPFETLYCGGIDEFVNEINNMKIGQPVKNMSSGIQEFIESLITYAVSSPAEFPDSEPIVSHYRNEYDEHPDIPPIRSNKHASAPRPRYVIYIDIDRHIEAVSSVSIKSSVQNIAK